MRGGCRQNNAGSLSVAAVSFCECLAGTLLLGTNRSGKVAFGGGSVAQYQQIVCTQCDKPEQYCSCEKYCTICKGQSNVRLCTDGLYYCPDCREACDMALANDR